MVSNVVTLESVQSIAYALSLSHISFSLETFVEIAAALPLVCICFFCNFGFVVVSFCVGFVDDFTTETCVAAPAALDWVFVFFIGLELREHPTWCFPINAGLLATLDTTLLINCKDNIFGSLEQWNFDITLGGEHVKCQHQQAKPSTSSRKVFLSLWTYHFFP
jgi:hypothetical protein